MLPMTRIETVQGTGVVWEGEEGQTNMLPMTRIETVQGTGVVWEGGRRTN